MAKLGEFHDTRNLYIELLGYKEPLSFDEWVKKPDDQKAAFLFVQFYNEITYAWEKADSRDFGDPSEGVFTIMQYLQKHVSQIQYFQKDDPKKKANAEFRSKHPDGYIAVERRMIEDDPSKFSPGYIYRVAYNCLYCICGHDRKCDKDRMEKETSSIVMYDGQELNLFDTMSDASGSAADVSEVQNFEREFWSVIENVGMPAEKVMRYLLSHDKDDLKALNPRNKKYKVDPLRDIEVSLDKVDEILAQIREAFLDLPSNSICGQHILDLPMFASY